MVNLSAITLTYISCICMGVWGSNVGTVYVQVSSSVGSKFLDKRSTIRANSSTTVEDVKKALSSQHVGAPPSTLQRLFLGATLLQDDNRIFDLASNSTKLSLLLDYIPTSTTQYDSATSFDELLSSVLALKIAIRFVDDLLSRLSDEETAHEFMTSQQFHTAQYRQRLAQDKDMIHRLYSKQIDLARKAEQDPVLYNPLTPNRKLAVRQGGFVNPKRTSKSVFLHLLKRQFNIDWGYTLGAINTCQLFGVFGTSVEWGRTALCVYIPILILVAQLRPARFALKVLFHLLPPLEGAIMSLFTPLLPVTVQVINQHSSVWRHPNPLTLADVVERDEQRTLLGLDEQVEEEDGEEEEDEVFEDDEEQAEDED